MSLWHGIEVVGLLVGDVEGLCTTHPSLSKYRGLKNYLY